MGRTGAAGRSTSQVPLAIHPMNDLWNLVLADASFNSHVKRDRLPTERTFLAYLTEAYAHYAAASQLGPQLWRDATGRFSTLRGERPAALTDAVQGFVRQVATTRGVARFDGRAA